MEKEHPSKFFKFRPYLRLFLYNWDPHVGFPPNLISVSCWPGVLLPRGQYRHERFVHFDPYSIKGWTPTLARSAHGDFMPRSAGAKTKRKIVKTRIKNASLIDRRRKQIIDGALRAFTAKGFHKATVREIAREAGLTMGSLYNYIRSKEDIIFIVYDYITGVLRDEMRAAIEGIEDPKQRLKAAVWQNLKAVDEYQDIIMFLYKESSSLDRESLHSVLARETEYIELFENLLRGYFKGREINETRVRIAADLMSYIPVIVTFRRWSLKHRFESMEIVMNNILDFVLRGIDFIPTAREESDG
jgi:AcrR family transcriptional regulator